MIDLKKLEEKIDALLEKETTESLNNWLLKKREANLKEILGNGVFEPLKKVEPCSFKTAQNCPSNFVFKEQNGYCKINASNKIAA